MNYDLSVDRDTAVAKNIDSLRTMVRPGNMMNEKDVDLQALLEQYKHELEVAKTELAARKEEFGRVVDSLTKRSERAEQLLASARTQGENHLQARLLAEQRIEQLEKQSV